ncbi:MAG: hypothetical protein RSC29_05145, partial [Oscillospiraceae bacterium]
NITTTNGWWLNEPVDEYENSVHYVSKNGKVLMETSSNTLAIRPLFRVGHEFFKNTQLDVDYMGVCVKEMLFNNFSASELSKIGYSEVEKSVIRNKKPRVSEIVKYIGPKKDEFNINHKNDTRFELKFSVDAESPIEYKIRY